MKTATFKIWRGDTSGGAFHDYTAEISEGMVVLDAVNQIQATQANDLACRWNCKVRFVFGGGQRDAKADVYDAPE